MARWRHCAISSQRLRQPVVACGLGKLYNKEAVIEALLDRSKMPDDAAHIKSLKVRHLIHSYMLNYTCKCTCVHTLCGVRVCNVYRILVQCFKTRSIRYIQLLVQQFTQTSSHEWPISLHLHSPNGSPKSGQHLGHVLIQAWNTRCWEGRS